MRILFYIYRIIPIFINCNLLKLIVIFKPKINIDANTYTYLYIK